MTKIKLKGQLTLRPKTAGLMWILVGAETGTLGLQMGHAGSNLFTDLSRSRSTVGGKTSDQVPRSLNKAARPFSAECLKTCEKVATRFGTNRFLYGFEWFFTMESNK